MVSKRMKFLIILKRRKRIRKEEGDKSISLFKVIGQP
jgi:hypothetical protein